MGTLLELLQCYVEQCEKFLCRIVTGDKTWVFHYSPQSKAVLIWKRPGSPVAKKSRRLRAMASIFWDMLQNAFGGVSIRLFVAKGLAYCLVKFCCCTIMPSHTLLQCLGFLRIGNSASSCLQSWLGTLRLAFIPQAWKESARTLFSLRWRCQRSSRRLATSAGKHQGLNSLICWYGKCLDKQGNCMEKYGNYASLYMLPFLPSTFNILNITK